MIHKREFAVVVACLLAGCAALLWHPYRQERKAQPGTVSVQPEEGGTKVTWNMPDRVEEKEDRSWPGGMCLRCRKAKAELANVEFKATNGGLEPLESAGFGGDSRGLGVLCAKCWGECSAAERLDYCEQVTTGFLGNGPWPRSKRLAVLKAMLSKP